MDKKILEEQKLMMKIMSYKVGQPVSEKQQQQFNESSYFKKAATAVYNTGVEVGDYLSGNQGKIPDAMQKNSPYLRGEEGILPGDQSHWKNLKAGTMLAGGIIFYPALNQLTNLICGRGVAESVAALMSGMDGKIPASADNVTEQDKQDRYRFRLRYYSPGKSRSNNMFGLPSSLLNDPQFPVTGHIGVKPDDPKLNTIVKNGNADAYWTDWGPGSSGAKEMGGLLSHKFTRAFKGCKTNSKSCGRPAEGDFYIYLTRAQVKHYYQHQPKYKNRKHGKWGPFEIPGIGKIPSMPNFCNSKGYHVGKNNCADATSDVLGLSVSSDITTPYEVTTKALTKFPNKDADGENIKVSVKGVSTTSRFGPEHGNKVVEGCTTKQKWYDNVTKFSNQKQYGKGWNKYIAKMGYRKNICKCFKNSLPQCKS